MTKMTELPSHFVVHSDFESFLMLFSKLFYQFFMLCCIISIFMTPYISIFQTQTQRSRNNENTKEGQAGQCITCVAVSTV